MTILRPFTSVDIFDAEVCLLVDGQLLMSIDYDRGAAFVRVAPTISPSSWFRIYEILGFMKVEREWIQSPERPSIPFGLEPMQLVVAEALEEADSVMPFLRENFHPEPYFSFAEEFYKRKRERWAGQSKPSES